MKKYLLVLLAVCCSCGQIGKAKLKESWLYVIHARDGNITPTELTLINPDGHVLAFTDRPVRKTAMVPYREFVKMWPKSFDDINPNATISYYDQQGHYHGDAVELIDPKVVNGRIVFVIKALDDVKITAKTDLGETAVFIDGGSLPANIFKDPREMEYWVY